MVLKKKYLFLTCYVIVSTLTSKNIQKSTQKAILCFYQYPVIQKYSRKSSILGHFHRKISEKKKNPGKPLKRSPPGFDHLVHTYRGPNDQFWGVQMFLVLEIFFFFRNRVFFEPVTFSRYTREQKPPGNLRN